MNQIFKTWLRNYLSWKKSVIASLVGDAIEPLIYFLGFGYGFRALIGNINGIDYISFLTPGVIMSSAMTGASYECTFGSFTRFFTRRNYDSIFITPVKVEEVVIGDILWGTAKGLLASIFTFTLAFILGYVRGFDILILLNATLTAFLFSSSSLLFTSFSNSYTSFSYYFTVFISPMFVLSGVFFPVETFPRWAYYVSRLLPLTYSVEISRSIHRGEISPKLIIDVLILISLSTLFVWGSIKGIKRRIIN